MARCLTVELHVPLVAGLPGHDGQLIGASSRMDSFEVNLLWKRAGVVLKDGTAAAGFIVAAADPEPMIRRSISFATDVVVLITCLETVWVGELNDGARVLGMKAYRT